MSETDLESPAEVVKFLSLAEKAKRLGIDPEGKDDQQLTQDIIAFRENQPDYVRACEYITGMLPDNPRLLPKLAEDQLIIRQKYGLPNVSILINDPAEYERIIREACKKYGFTIATKSECADYFTLHQAMAVTLPPDLDKIHVDIKRNEDLPAYKASIRALEHEYIHCMQHLKYPGLPPENVEYEPYILIQNMQKLEKEDPVDRVHFIFGFGFLTSLKAFYGEIGQKIFWNNPQWFLRNVDGIVVKK